MKFGIINFPGSTGVEDLQYALEHILEQQTVVLWHKDRIPDRTDMLILPSGASFGDDLRPGAIARFSPIITELTKFASRGGLVLGIANGFQILCETGLLPGTLLINNTLRYNCRSAYIKADNNHSQINQHIAREQSLKIPVSIKYGRYYANDDTLAEMRENKQITFRFCNAEGKSTERSNPLGSSDNIAGICNNRKNVYGIIPIPERATDDELGNTDGKALFESFYTTTSNHQ